MTASATVIATTARPTNRQVLDAGDDLGKALQQLSGLASCITVLARADRTSEVIDELTDDALPMLGWVMQDIVTRARAAADLIELRRSIDHPPQSASFVGSDQ